MAKLKIAHGSTIDQGRASGFGGTGGQPSTVTSGVKTIALTYNTSGNVQVADGYIISQKGAKKFLVANSASVGSNITTITLVNKVDGALEANEGTIHGYTTANVGFFASRITSKHVYDFDGNKYIYKIDTPATESYANVSVA
jgi:hypothetical protein